MYIPCVSDETSSSRSRLILIQAAIYYGLRIFSTPGFAALFYIDSVEKDFMAVIPFAFPPRN